MRGWCSCGNLLLLPEESEMSSLVDTTAVRAGGPSQDIAHGGGMQARLRQGELKHRKWPRENDLSSEEIKKNSL